MRSGSVAHRGPVDVVGCNLRLSWNELGKTRACDLPNLRKDYIGRNGVPSYGVSRLIVTRWVVSDCGDEPTVYETKKLFDTHRSYIKHRMSMSHATRECLDHYGASAAVREPRAFHHVNLRFKVKIRRTCDNIDLGANDPPNSSRGSFKSRPYGVNLTWVGERPKRSSWNVLELR